MDYKDISLLGALDILLNEGSVVGAAEKLHLSSSVVSRILVRIRAVTGDDILVPAGRTMVLTAHAESLRDEVRKCVRTAPSLLERKQALDASTLSRTFTVRANDSIITAFGHRWGVIVVPDERKAQAVKSCVEGEITPQVPASILRTHSNASLYLDRNSADLLSAESRSSPERIRKMQ